MSVHRNRFALPSAPNDRACQALRQMISDAGQPVVVGLVGDALVIVDEEPGGQLVVDLVTAS